jgi:hypothetical protein
MNSFCARFPCGRTQHDSRLARSKSGLTGSFEVWIVVRSLTNSVIVTIYGCCFNSTEYSTSIKMWRWPLRVLRDLYFGYLTTFYQLRKHRIRRGNDHEYDKMVRKRRIWCISNNFRGICLKGLSMSPEGLRNVARIPARIEAGSFRIRRWCFIIQ